ncbi:hypothetical protein GCM10010440_57630 [Kitasatospora cinereorecta]
MPQVLGRIPAYRATTVSRSPDCADCADRTDCLGSDAPVAAVRPPLADGVAGGARPADRPPAHPASASPIAPSTARRPTAIRPPPSVRAAHPPRYAAARAATSRRARTGARLTLPPRQA